MAHVINGIIEGCYMSSLFLSDVDILEQAEIVAVMHCTNDLTPTCAMTAVGMLPIITMTSY